MPTSAATKPVQYLGVKLSGNVIETPEGFLVFKNAVIARTGFMTYKGRELLEWAGDQLSELGVKLSSDDDVEVYRSAEELFSKRTMCSFEGKPVTDLHPEEFVDIDTHSELAHGHIQNVRQGDEPLDNGDLPLLADIFVTSPDLIAKWRSGIRELSCGYNYNFVFKNSRLWQVDLVGNHVAFVPNGRGGQHVRVMDSKPKTENTMAKFFDAIFGKAAKEHIANQSDEEVGSFFGSLGFNRASDSKENDDKEKKASEAKDAAEKEAKEKAEAEDAALAADAAAALDALTKDAKSEDKEEKEENKSEDAEDDEEVEKAKSEDADEDYSEEFDEADKPKPVVPRATDAAYEKGVRDGKLATLTALKPVVARLKNPGLNKAFDDASKLVKETPSVAKGSYNKAAGAAAKSNDSAKDHRRHEEKTNQDMENMYAEFGKKERARYGSR